MFELAVLFLVGTSSYKIVMPDDKIMITAAKCVGVSCFTNNKRAMF